MHRLSVRNFIVIFALISVTEAKSFFFYKIFTKFNIFVECSLKCNMYYPADKALTGVVGARIYRT